ncbi:MAG: PAS domain S-box protein [Spirochaetaceae bacterium]|nr:MAG: PAS domain S-box protein [Spirochaetaceae bacterium]
MTTLLVEDEAIIAAAETAALQRHGFDVVHARSGEEALEVVQSTADVSLILMDIDLGSGIDGTEAARRILAQREVPIVFLTSHSEPEFVDRVAGISGYGYVLKDSGGFVLVETIRMAMRLFEARMRLKRENEDHHRTAQRLAERNTFIETVLDNLPIGLAVNYIDAGTATYMNRQFEAIYGWPKDVLTDIGRFFDAVYPDPGYRDEIKSRVLADIASGDPRRMVWDDVVTITQDGEQRIVRAQNIPIPEQNVMISTVQNQTQQKHIEEALRESEQTYRFLVDSLHEGIMQIDGDGVIVFVNTRMAEMLGYTPADMVGRNFLEFMDERGQEIARKAVARRRAGVVEQMEAEFRCRNGRPLHVLLETGPIRDADGRYRGAIAGVMDITARKESQLMLERQIREKNLLLRETHHRIKNNIATIASLLSMQAEKLSIPEARAALREATSRVRSMRELYDTMLIGESQHTVALDHYLGAIIESVIELFAAEATIKRDIELAPCECPAKRAFSLGIIVNELMTNIMKHAFANRSAGTITVTLQIHGSEAQLNVRDNGVGLPEGFSIDNENGFGTALVRMLSEELNAQLTMTSDGGTSVTLRFGID